ncbi:MAG: Hsp70 family protein, partial [Oscillospiraceae bacterium]
GICTKIIERNTTIPSKKSQVFSTAADNQTSVEINVLQGEREMAKDNKQLGMFRLDGIAPARRGEPQVEVTFDIDANGIVHVSAKDLGTGKTQNITITSSTNMSKDEIDKAVLDAEKFAAEDKKNREEVEIRNNADQMIFQCEKALADAGDKLPAAEKAPIEADINSLKEALKGTDYTDIKTKHDALQNKLYDLMAKAQQAGAPTGDAGAAPEQDTTQQQSSDKANDDYVDADYKDVD